MQAGAHFRLLRKIQTFPRNQTRKPSAFHGTRYVSHQMSTLCPSPPFRKLWRYPPHLENLWEDGAFPRNKGVEIKPAAFRGKGRTSRKNSNFSAPSHCWRNVGRRKRSLRNRRALALFSPQKAGWGQVGAGAQDLDLGRHQLRPAPLSAERA
jgi:hypothetical protein